MFNRASFHATGLAVSHLVLTLALAGSLGAKAYSDEAEAHVLRNLPLKSAITGASFEDVEPGLDGHTHTVRHFYFDGSFGLSAHRGEMRGSYNILSGQVCTELFGSDKAECFSLAKRGKQYWLIQGDLQTAVVRISH
jgi:hypothetical protein